MQHASTRRWRRSATITLLTIGAMLGSIAFAQWLAKGEGQGRAEAGAAEDLVVTAAAPSDAMYPGGTAAVALTVHNPNPYPVTVTLVEQVPGEDITSDGVGCDVSNHGVTFSTQTTSFGVAADGSTTIELPDAAAMSLDTAEACQGATFSIPLRVTGSAGSGGRPIETYYRDSDADSFGNSASTVSAVERPAGYAKDAGDCDDDDPAVNPGATEILNGIDDDCDGDIDEGLGSTWFLDADGDGYGTPSSTVSATTQPAGYVDNSSDCDDSRDSVHPGATETLNGIDDDCDGDVDEGLSSIGWYDDDDGDGYGDPDTLVASQTQPEGHVSIGGDCDDSNASINPGATEVAGDGIDNDCDGVIDDGA